MGLLSVGGEATRHGSAGRPGAEMTDDDLDLGSCCACGREIDGVQNALLLPMLRWLLYAMGVWSTDGH